MILTSLFAIAPSFTHAQGPLRSIDSTLIRENDSVLLGRIGYVATGPKGHLFVTDYTESRVVEITSKGEIVRTFGRKGNGPGELASVGPVVFFGDTLMLVMDNGQRRIVTFDLRTGKSSGGFRANLRYPALAAYGNEIFVTTTNPTTGTSFAIISATGEVKANEGAIPAIAKKYPPLLDPFMQSAIAIRGRDVFIATELSQSIFVTTRGTKTSTEFRVPNEKRWGVNDALFVQIINDPSKATPDLIYHHSTPVALGLLSADVFGVVTLEPKLNTSGGYIGIHYLSLVDTKRRRACVDLLLPIPTDPLPHMAFAHDTLVVIQQASDKQDQPASAIRRFVVNQKLCKWTAL